MPRIEHLYGAVLDTHVWIWTTAADPRAQSLRTFKGRSIISAISIWEVAMLESKGRLALKPDVENWIQSNLSPPVVLEPISPAIAVESCRLPHFHGDPADRLIVATAFIDFPVAMTPRLHRLPCSDDAPSSPTFP